MMVLRPVLLGMKGHLVHRFAEWSFSALMVAFSSALLSKGDTFASSHSYDFMASMARENTWGWGLLAVASTRLLALAINGSFAFFRPWSPAVRSATSWLSSAAWMLLALSMYNGNAIGTGWRIYCVLGVCDVALAFTIAGEAGDRVRRHIYGSS